MLSGWMLEMEIKRKKLIKTFFFIICFISNNEDFNKFKYKYINMGRKETKEKKPD